MSIDNEDADFDTRETWVTVGETFERVPSPSTVELPNHEPPNIYQKTVERIEGTDVGEPLYDSYNQNQRLDPSEPAPTIMVGSGQGTWKYAHPHEDRGITNRERALLQGFPTFFVFCGGRTDVLRQTGNAVPVDLGEAVASSMMDEL